MNRFLDTPWSVATKEVLLNYHTRPDGLTPQEASLRHRRDGPNELPNDRETTLAILLRQFKSPLLLILLFAAAASYYVGQQNSAITIMVMMAVSIFLGFINEYRSEKIVQHLHAHIRQTTSVLRNGMLTEIPSREVVVGDIVPLLPGTIVPADVRLIDAEGLEMNESILTGESIGQLKSINAIEGKSLAHYQNCAYFGTHVAAGHGLGVVFRIGTDTSFGHIAGSISTIRPEGEFGRGLRQFGFLLVRVVAIIAIIIFGLNAALGRPILESLLFTLAIAIGLTPELLPAIVSVSMAKGASSLAKKRVLIKRLVAIEDLGNIDVLCTDKTGTLTEGVLRVQQYATLDNSTPNWLMECAEWSCEKARAHHPLTSPFDVAIMNYQKEHHKAVPRVSFISELVFDFNRRRASKLVKTLHGNILITRGAPGPVIAVCTQIRHLGGVRALSTADRHRIIQYFEDQSKNGVRVLGIGTRKLSAAKKVSAEDERDLIFEGFILCDDRIKKSAVAATRLLKAQEVRLCVVSGDNELVCRHVCEGIIDVDTIMTGDQLEQMSDAQLQRAIMATDIFAPVTPEQKARIIRALKQHHLTVGFLGDGINDATALHEADVGISVSSAVDIAKDAANVVLLKTDLQIIADGIIEGRRIFSNTIKYIFMGTSSNFGNMVSAAIGSFILPFLPMLPVQILLTNVLYDVSQVAIPTDAVDEEDLRKPRHWDVGFIERFMLVFGPISSLYDMFTFAIMIFIFHATAGFFQTGWFIESLMTQTLVIFVFRTRRVPFFKSKPSLILLTSALVIISIGLAIPFTPIGRIFQFESINWRYFAVFVVLAITYLFVVDFIKQFFFRFEAKRYSVNR